MSLRNHVIGTVLFLLFVCGWMAFGKEFRRAHHPSDESLIAGFQAHQDGFAKLIEMAREDYEVLTVYPDQVMLVDYRIWPKNCSHCFSSRRFDLYKERFADLGNVQPYRLSKNSGKLFIPVSFRSTEPDEDYQYLVSEKGFVYSENQPAELVESLNGMGFETKGTFYKKIGRNWYLYHDWGVGKPE